MAVVLDTPRFHDLAELGAKAPVVLTTDRRTSGRLEYRLPHPLVPGTWVKVMLRARIELAPARRNPGFGRVVALTDGQTSAMVELSTVRGDATQWSAVGLHSGGHGVTRSRSLRVAYSNYVRTKASHSGLHTLAFRLRSFDGFRVSRVVVEPGSGLFLTRQPPQALTARAVVGQGGITLQVRNRGVVPARHLSLDTLTDTDALRLRPVGRLPVIAPGSVATIPVQSVRLGPGDQKAQLLVSSDKGQALVRVTVPDPGAAGGASPAPSSEDDRGSGGASGPRLAGLIAAALAAAAAGAVAVRTRRGARG